MLERWNDDKTNASAAAGIIVASVGSPEAYECIVNDAETFEVQ